MRPRLAWLIATAAALLALPGVTAAQSGITRYVNHADATCGGHAPCYGTIQAAVTAAQAGDTVQIQAGTYVEQVQITGKNNTAGATEADRLVIQGDPTAAVGSVVLHGAVGQCTQGYAIRLQQSKFITLRGLTITGAGGEAIALMGGNNQNTAIHIERNRIVGNGGASCNGGITIASGNPDTLIVNNLIYGNGRNGIATIDATGGPHAIIENAIHGNQWSGVNVTRSHQVLLANNAITGNGTATGTTGGRFGVVRESANPPNPAGIHLVNNLVCGNRLGELSGPILDATDSGNLTPTGSEGTGAAASPGCENPSTVYAGLNGLDGLANTLDDNFAPATTSPLVDHGIDPRTLGLPSAFDPLLEADYLQESVRPRAGTPGNPAHFDIGALELGPPDTQAPSVVFLQPPANAHLRQTVTVQAQATDTGGGVATLTLQAESQALTTTLVPTPPAASVTGTASWTTTGATDGTHTLTAAATDPATNAAQATRVVIVDNTPPNTTITGGPTGEITTPSTSLTFTGTDNLTPVGSLVFAWRLDGGPYSAFSAATIATLTGLTEGTHTFEVKARDLAGNEDPTPASRLFSVRFGPSISTVTPTTGPIGTLVTLTGTGFVPGGTTVTFNGLPAVLRTLTATQLTTTVPIGASTGPLVVLTAAGSTSATFTVTLTGDFTLTAAPAAPGTVRVIAGDQGSAQVSAAGTGSFTSLVTLSVSAGAAGITPALLQPAVAPGGTTAVRFGVATTVAAGTYALTVTGQAQVDGQLQTRTASVSLEVLAATTPAITGQVLTAEAVPVGIPGVTVTVGSAFVLTDAAGNFTLLAPPTGPNMLLVDGRTASTPTAQYPPVEIQVNVAPTGPTRVPFPLYLPKLDTAHPITFPLDGNGFTTQQVLATTPLIPGLVVTIPQGTKITGPDGNPVSQITITPVPVDRSPMPFPLGTRAPMLFTIQPGGAVPSQPLPITFPNPTNATPASSADLYFFDLIAGNWATWGTGAVSQDGTQIVSDAGFGLPRFAWHYPFCGAAPTTPARTTGVDPVDLFTGRLSFGKVDLILSGRVPVAIQRSYQGSDPQPGLLGLGWTLDLYDTVLTTAGTSLRLVAADGSSSLFAPVAPGEWASRGEPALRGVTITQVPGDFRFQVRFRDGSVHQYERLLGFADAAVPAAIGDRNGNTVILTRNPAPFVNRQITQIAEPSGRALTLTYDTEGRVDRVTDPIGREVRYTYDAAGRLETVTDTGGGMTRYAYDGNNRLVTATDPRGIAFLTNEYDAQGRVIRQIQADGGVWAVSYVKVGTFATQTTVSDPNGSTTTYRFSPDGFPLSITDALGQTTIFQYMSGSNLLVSITDSLGRTISYEYDVAGNVTRIVSPDGTERRFQYESAFNRLTAIVAPLGQTTQYEYDAQGNMTARTTPSGARTTLTYQPDGSPASITDPLGHTTVLTYDPAGNLASVRDPLGNVSTRAYDGVSRLVRTVTPLGAATQFTYDALDRVVQVTDPLGGVTQYSYDPNGNLLTVRDPRTMTTTHSYDAMDRLSSRADALGRIKSFVYDPRGNLRQMTDPKGQVSTVAYDATNRRIRETYGDGATTEFFYDAGSRLASIADSEGGVIEQEYDLQNRLLRETTGQGTVSYTYDALGRRTSLNAGGGPSVTYSYDVNSRVRTIAQAPLAPLTLDYDVRGVLTRLALPNGVSSSYEHDAAARLVRIAYEASGVPLGDLTYQYDASGRRTGTGGTLARIALPGAVLDATYDAVNQQLAFGTKTMAFDANGNLTQLVEPGSNTSFSWDARDRLRLVAAGASMTTLAYDALGRRTGRTVDGVTTAFEYSLGDVIRESRPGGDVRYLRGLGIDQTFYENEDTGYLLDALQNTIALVDAAGAISQSFTYEPFGRVETSGAPDRVRYQFTGRERDTDDLYYFRARYYHPGLARFIQADPLGLAAGHNLYAYAANDPISLIDPLGLRTYVAHGTSTQGNTGDWPGFLDALRQADRDTQLFRWSGNLVGDTIPSTDRPSADLLNQILSDLEIEPLVPGEKLNLVGHSGGGIIVNNVANALQARGIKVDNLILFGTPLSPGTFNAPLPPGVPVTNFVGRYDPISRRLPAGPNASNIGVDTGSSDAYTAHTSYTRNPVVINTIQGLIRSR